ncbi:PROTEIN NEN3 [Salix purpurea]|uniref:PROTEIN NEN3 n=1 Tax=Salix purpurea TaxID=77065 RepID=A0A9Q0V8H6_SALPP|nr:PROTEIN NEN3 [Salix purpurea]
MENKTEIAFFDVETTLPTPPGQGRAILEFGAILVCHQKLEELMSYSTLVRPSNPNSYLPCPNGVMASHQRLWLQHRPSLTLLIRSTTFSMGGYGRGII